MASVTRSVSTLALLVSACLIAFLASSCTGSKKTSTLKVTPDFLTMRGMTTSPSDTPLGGVSIYLPGDELPYATSGDDGSFEITLRAPELVALTQKARATLPAANHFNVYFESSRGGVPLAGLISSEELSRRGDKDYGRIAMHPVGSLKGSVQAITANTQAHAAPGVTVAIGRQRATTNAEGTFEIKNLPAGELQLVVMKDGFVTQQHQISLAVGEDKRLDTPIVLFADDTVAGWVALLPPEDNATLVRDGHPYRRSFAVSVSPLAKYMRYATDRSLLETSQTDQQGTTGGSVGPLGSEWTKITETFDYDFAGNGAHELYFQFADDTKQTFSPVFAQHVVVDIFAGSKGIITIEDGSGFITRRNVTVHLDVPASATRMRLSTTLSDFAKQPPTSPRAELAWMVAQNVTEFVFPVVDDELSSGYKELFVQFADPSGYESDVHRAAVTMELFPTNGTPFVVEGGAESTASRFVRLDIQVPQNAYQMRIFEGLDSITRRDRQFVGNSVLQENDPFELWLRADALYFYMFETSGLKTIYVQFRDRDGIQSPVYQQTIRVFPFPPLPVGFTINGGAPTSVTRDVTVELVPPPNAVAFRFAENGTPGLVGDGRGGVTLIDLGWINLTPAVPYTLNGGGTRTIYLQYKDVDGEVSSLYVQSIHVDPFLGGAGSFVVNGNSPLTSSPLVTLDIDVPLAARWMRVTNALPFNESDAPWLEARPQIEHLFLRAGVKTLYLQFKSLEGDISGAVQRSIIYDPFPLGSLGIQLDGGAPITDNTRVEATLSAPPQAFYYRMFLRPEDQFSEPYLLIPPGGAVFATLAERNGFQRVHVQYMTLQGDESQIVFNDIELRIFPQQSLTVRLNDGDATTTSATVTAKLTPPPLARTLKYGESPTALTSTQTLPTEDTGTVELPIELSSGLGVKRVYFQYVTAGGTTSAVFFDEIERQ